jgi:hypothetical protein
MIGRQLAKSVGSSERPRRMKTSDVWMKLPISLEQSTRSAVVFQARLRTRSLPQRVRSGRPASLFTEHIL